jgi:hypothetical protein
VTTRPPAVQITRMAIDDSRLRMSGKKHGPIAQFNGLKALKVSYQGGQRGGGSTDTNVKLSPSPFFPAEEVWFGFKWWVPTDYPWRKGQVEKIGGKIIGLFIGTGDASGGNYSTTGASFRLTWGENGELHAYVYPQVRQAAGASPGAAALDQSPEVQAVWQVTGKGTSLFKGRSGMYMKTGAWNDISMYARLNTPGQKNGILKFSLNGVSKQLTTYRYRYDNAKINNVTIHSFFGGGDNRWAPPRSTTSYYADPAFATGDPYPTTGLAGGLGRR